MIEFVEQCREAWRGLGVPDPVANEMAADLEADLSEAAGEGVSAEEVLGSGAFDPRGFAAAWARARGVVPPPVPVLPAAPAAPVGSRRASRVGLALALSGLAVLLGLVLASRRSGASGTAFALPLIRRLRVPARAFFPPGPTPVVFTGPDAPFVRLGILLVLLGLLGLAVTGAYWLWRRASNRTGPPYLGASPG